MEALGVASGAAGVLSVAITVCQSLLEYYHSWKDAEDNVAKTYVSVEELTKILKLLATAIESKEFSGEIVSQIQDSIQSAAESLRSLGKKLDKVRIVTLQKDWKDKAKAQFRRTLYPFKESTLVKLRELTSEARNNLSIALNLLQVDASAASLRRLGLLGQQTAHVSESVIFLKEQSTSISANVHEIAGSTRETARFFDSLALNEKNKEIRAWLSGPFDPTRKQDETWRERHPGTGQWFLQSPEFQAWLEGPAQRIPRVLNLVGKSGAGKTSLISSAIKAAQSVGRDDPQTAVAYFYCSFNEAASQNPSNMVGSIISQVSTVCPNLLKGLEVDSARNERPMLEDLVERLTSETALKSLILIDAVNECKNVEPMIRTLLRLAKSASDIRVLFTSTEEDPSITELAGLEPPKALAFGMSALNTDIDIFIEAKIKEKRNLQLLPPEMREEVKKTLSSKADGM